MFQKLPSNSRNLLNEIICAENPVQFLCDRFNKASQKEDAELRGVLRELREKGYININWADDKPYFVTINNSARTYEEHLLEYETQNERCDKVVYNYGTINDQSVKIGDGNTINNSTIAGNVVKENPYVRNVQKQRFNEKHPVIFGIVISLITGLILMFSFWEYVIDWIERLI